MLSRNRNFMLLWVGQAVSEMGTAVTVLALPLIAVHELDASTLELGMLAATGTLGWFFLSLPAGVLVDRVRKRSLMIWCDLARLGLLVSIPLAAWWGGLSLAQLLLVQLLVGAATVLFELAYWSLVPLILPPEQLLAGNSRIGTTTAVASVSGPPVAGGLTGVTGSAVQAVLLDSVTFLVSLVSLLRITTPEPPHTRNQTRRGLLAEIREGLGYVAGQRLLRRILAFGAFYGLFSEMMAVLLLVFLIRDLAASPATVGLVLGCGAVGAVTGGLAVGRVTRWIGQSRVLWQIPLLAGGFALLMPLARPGWGVALVSVGIFVSAMAIIMFHITQISYRQSVCPKELLGRMNAAMRWVLRSGRPVGALLAGVLGSFVEVRTALAVAALGAWLAALWLVPVGKFSIDLYKPLLK